MGKKLLGVFLLTILLASAVADGASEASPKVLEMVPADAQVVLAVPSLSGLEEALGAFLNSVAPEAAAHLTGGLNKLYTLGTGKADGLDLAAPAVMILLGAPAPAPATEEGEFGGGEGGGEEDTMLVLIPVSDVAAWRSAVGEKIGKEEGATYEHVEGGWGEQLSFTLRDGYLVATDSSESLDRWAKALANPLGQARKAAILEGIARSPICVDVSIEAVRKAKPDFPDSLFESLPFSLDDAPAAQAAAVKLYLGVIRDLVEDMDGVFVEFVPSAAGLKISAKATAAEGGLFHKVFSAQEPADLSGLDHLPADSMMFGAGRFNPDPLVDYMKNLVENYIRASAEGQEEADIKGAVENLHLTIDQARQYGLLRNASFAMTGSTGEGMFNVVATYVTPEAVKAVEMFERQQRYSQQNPVLAGMAATSGVGMSELEITEETIAGVGVKVVRQSFDLEDADPMMAQIVRTIYGEAMVTRLAAKGDRLYLVMGEDKAVMERLLTGTGTGLDAAKVQRSLEPMDGKPSGVMFISVPDFMVLIASITMGAGGAGESLPAIQAPPTSRFAALAVSFSGGSARLELNVPSEQVNAAKMVMMQVMMQQMQMEGPGEAPGGPPWQPEAPPSE